MSVLAVLTGYGNETADDDNAADDQLIDARVGNSLASSSYRQDYVIFVVDHVVGFDDDV